MQAGIKIIDEYAHHASVTFALQVRAEDGHPLVVGCSVRTATGTIIDLPARRVRRNGECLWTLSAPPECRDGNHEPGSFSGEGWSGQVKFALWADASFTKRLADSGWHPWHAPWLIGASTAGLNIRDEELRARHRRSVELEPLSTRRYLWCYHLDQLPASEVRARAFADRVRSKLGVTDLFLSLGGILTRDGLDEQRLATLVRALQPLRVHAMILQDPRFLEPSRSRVDSIQRRLAWLDGYNLDHPNLALAGLHLDCEPHAHEEFGSRADELFERFGALLRFVRQQLDGHLGLSGPSFLYSAATGWWYEKHPLASVRVLGRWVDAVVPMAYSGKAEKPRGRERQAAAGQALLARVGASDTSGLWGDPGHGPAGVR